MVVVHSVVGSSVIETHLLCDLLVKWPVMCWVGRDVKSCRL